MNTRPLIPASKWPTPLAGAARAARPLATLVLGVSLLAVAAVPAASNAGAAEPAAVVGMTDDLRFEPAQITVRAGDTVEWRNTSQTVHTVTADPDKARDPEHVHLPEGAETFDSGILQPGETFRHTFEVPGSYTYFCIPHEMQGMIAEVTVEP